MPGMGRRAAQLKRWAEFRRDTMERLRLALLVLILVSAVILIASDETVGNLKRFGFLIIILLSVLIGLGIKILLSRIPVQKKVSTVSGILVGLGLLIYLLVMWDDFLERYSRTINIILLWVPVLLIFVSSISLYYLPKRRKSNN
jgi:hypothetical protein